GDGCGVADAVSVLVGNRLGGPTGPSDVAADVRAGLPPARDPIAAAPDTPTWHDDVPDGSGTGTLTTPWYPIPAGDPSDTVIVSATGDLRAGQEVVIEFRGGPDVVFPASGKQAGWLDRLVPLGDLGARPTEVRVVARDTLAGADTWLGVSAPRLAVAQSVPELTAGAPVFADQVSAVFWPCVDQIEMRDGLAEAPAFRLRASDGLEGAIVSNSTFPDNGGTLTPIDRSADFVELPSTLAPAGAPTLGWGHVERVVYDHPPGAYDLTVGEAPRHGWTRLPTLVGPAYTGRIYIG
ncbi:MAG: arabinosyltransferase C-terminal domain-containing protein, partial [Pseudonocardia sp.]|nr:arabinosyltransferase C-terminal domain-containing protein [Pseudonocardia sp.]